MPRRPVKIELVDNISRRVLDSIVPAIAQSDECRIAVAFMSSAGLSLLEPALRECLGRGGYAEFLVGLDLSATEPDALCALHRMAKTAKNAAWYCFPDLKRAALYHPKLYLMRAAGTATILVGSSNLTEGGLKSNIEVNALIRAQIDEEVVSDTYEVYNSLKFHKLRRVPSEELLSAYREIWSLRRKHEEMAAKDPAYRNLMSRFGREASALQRPVPTRNDLFGWQRLVFEKLPQGRFKTRDMYQFEQEFSRAYPENRNIRAKVRQVLQQLRDMNLVAHVARETWVKEHALREAGA